MPENVALPILSVVIPNHNYGKWVSDAIMSVATDPYPSKQIFIVDDGSTDNSWEVIRKVCDLSSPVVPVPDTIFTGKVLNTRAIAYHFAEAGGPSRARNLGIRALFQHTHIFGFLDADDIYLPGKIEKSINKFIQDPVHIGAIYTDYDTMDIETKERRREYKEPFDRERLMQECIVHSACMVSKLALQYCGGYDEEMRVCEDWDLWLRISERFIFVHIPESLMLVRVGSYNSTNSVDQTIWQKNWQRIRDKQRMKNE